jgi:CTP:molybdopterin cytidylyltransferase MocA
MSADQGLNHLLTSGPVREVPVFEPVSGNDLDTPADFARLQNRHDPNN